MDISNAQIFFITKLQEKRLSKACLKPVDFICFYRYLSVIVSRYQDQSYDREIEQIVLENAPSLSVQVLSLHCLFSFLK